MLAIAGGKGGAGKTTVVLGLALALARTGQDPVVVDADVDMPDLHVVTGIDREPTGEALTRDRPLECVLQRPPDLAGVGIVTAGRPETVPETLDRVERWHGPVLVDCPAGASRDAVRPLRACHRTLLVTTGTQAALEDTVKTAAVARQVDAPPLCVVVRGEVHGSLDRFDCPVDHLPVVDTTPPHRTPRVQSVCQAIVRRLST